MAAPQFHVVYISKELCENFKNFSTLYSVINHCLAVADEIFWRCVTPEYFGQREKSTIKMIILTEIKQEKLFSVNRYISMDDILE